MRRAGVRRHTPIRSTSKTGGDSVNSTTIVDVMDVRPGGAWQLVSETRRARVWLPRRVREVVPPERLRLHV